MKDNDLESFGHNGLDPHARDALRQAVAAIERMLQERKDIADDIKGIYSGLKAEGFDVKTVKKLIAEKAKDTGEREQQRALLDLYLVAMGIA